MPRHPDPERPTRLRHPRALLVALALLAAATLAAPAAARRPAPVTAAGWAVHPAGTRIGVSKLETGFLGPLGAALSPSGGKLLTVSSGAARLNSADLFDLRHRRRASTVSYDARVGTGEAAFYGVVFSPDGHRAWVSGGGQNVVHVLDVGSRLREVGEIPTPSFPAGLAYGHTPRGDRIYVANDLSGPPTRSVNPPGHQLTVIDPATNTVTGTIELGPARAPFGVTFERHGKKAYATNWLGRSVVAIDTATERATRTIRLSPAKNPLQADHPNAIAANPRGDEVYTANGNSDTVSVIDTRKDKLAATIDVSLVRGARQGATPDGLTASPDGRTLYVALANENAIAVVDLVRRRTTGFIPTSSYPTDVDVSPSGKTLMVTAANAVDSGPSRCGGGFQLPGCPSPDPVVDDQTGEVVDTDKALNKGEVDMIAVPRTPAALAKLTATVLRNNQVLARQRAKPPWLSKIKHVIYVVKENRTYDQYFGDLGKGRGDPSLTLFKDDVAPNQRALARRFTLFDNFYADADVSPDGHNWISQAGTTDYVDKTWPITYTPPPRRYQRVRDFEDVPQQLASEPLAGDPTVPRSAAATTGGYLWDGAFFHRVPYRVYGEYTTTPGDCAGATNTSHTTHLDPRFGDHVDPLYAGWNLRCSDHAQREPEWEREFVASEQAYAANPKRDPLPALEIVRLPNDHTAGTKPGRPTPASYVADNDLAVGRLVDTVSHSRFWKSTVILVTEDDAQDGADHVDAHRTVALAVSPYTQKHRVDSTHYDTAAMVATLEDLLGLPPMTIVDQRATRMWAAFAQKPDATPYNAVTPSVTPFGEPGAATNPSNAPMAAAASRWDFAKEDAAPEVALNQAIWKSVKGRGSEMPAPRHERIVESGATSDGDG